jgi:heterotetrameric sarcosine oxidase gamma subunit
VITLQRRSALSHRSILSGDGAAIVEKPFEGKLILRGDLARIGAGTAQVLAVGLPDKVHGTSTGARATAQWLGPDEWLLITAAGAESALAADLGKALASQHHQLADVTDYYTTLELSGAHAREMLMKVATVDFHPRAFKPGMGVTCNVGRANPVLRQTREDAFDILIRISMADYLWCLLAEAGHEWGLPGQSPKGQVKLHLPHFETGR